MYVCVCVCVCVCVGAHVQRVLEELGQQADTVPQDDIVLVCKNATNLRVVRRCSTTNIEAKET